MFVNFLGGFKNNLLFFKTRFANVFKKLNYFVILDFLVLVLTFILIYNLTIFSLFLDLLNPIFSYLISFDNGILLIYFIFSVRNLIINKIYYKTNILSLNNWNSLYLNMLYYAYSRYNLRSNIIYFYYNILFFIRIKFNFISHLWDITLFRTLYWYPIFKRHSIFGYYRIARQNWVELKSEEVNYLKY